MLAAGLMKAFKGSCSKIQCFKLASLKKRTFYGSWSKGWWCFIERCIGRGIGREREQARRKEIMIGHAIIEDAALHSSARGAKHRAGG